MNPFDMSKHSAIGVGAPNPFRPAAPSALNPSGAPLGWLANDPAWVSVAPAAPVAPLNVPPNAAVDRDTGEVLFEDDGVTPYDKDNLLNDWRKSAEALAKAKAYEADLRGKVVACYSDPTKTTGTENVPLGMGWFVKVEKKLSYNLKSFTEGLNKQNAVSNALTLLCQATKDSQGNELNPELGKVVATRLVKWEPELSVSEYKQLLPGHREIIDTVLEIKPASPTVSLVPPKEPKT